MSARESWRLVGDRNNGGEVGYGMAAGKGGRPVMRVNVPFANAELDLGDAYRLATGILEQLRAAGYIDR